MRLFDTGLIAASVALLLCGCVADRGKAARSADIVANGDASIENWGVKGLSVTRIFVLRIDGTQVQPSGKRGVYALNPGPHEIDVICSFSRMAISDLYLDGGMHRFRLDAKSGTRYRVRGEKLSVDRALLWIENVAGEQVVGDKIEVPLTAAGQNAPIPIPIPVRI
jgi:hypothetical protein